MAVGDYNEAAIAVRRYAEELDEEEEALVTAAQLFSRVCGRDNAVLAETSRMAEQATQLHPHRSLCILCVIISIIGKSLWFTFIKSPRGYKICVNIYFKVVYF